MALIDEVKNVCDRLAPLGWRGLLLALTDGELDLQAGTAPELADRLRKRLTRIDRTHPGFEDFSLDGAAGITPSAPGRSLLYHALAAPGVVTDDQGLPLRGFPTPRELEIVENYVFGAQPPSLGDLLDRANASELAIVVFAYEYRPARDTCSRKQADMVFSRTGVARTGTAPARYDARLRGYSPEVAEDPFAIRVCPARYAAFLAVRRPGDRAAALPMRFSADDEERKFWVPVHKLFDGKECLRGLDLTLELTALHVNEKILRIQRALGNASPPQTFPFRFTNDIAEFAPPPDQGHGLLVPVPHPRLVEPARQNGELVTFAVPRDNGSFFGALELQPGQSRFGEVRSAPAYIHARTQVNGNSLTDLGHDAARPDVLQTVRKGGYQALHYVDFTGDGQISCACPQLSSVNGVAAQTRPAYSLVTAPDFFPSCGQRELSEWANSREVPLALQSTLWAVRPHPLCDLRLPANLQLPGSSFDPAEDTISALVPLFGPAPTATLAPVSVDVARHGALPDDAAGVFAPGWDVAHDELVQAGQTIPHLAAYGLGSPFPEDAKLCAALSTFWPSVAPDTSRGLEPNPSGRKGTVAPLTDEEIGQSGGLPWDGVPGPKLVTINGQTFAECESFFHADYVESALAGKFTLRLTSRVTAAEYQRRVLAMSLAVAALQGDRDDWQVFSFTQVSPGSSELQQAENDTNTVLAGDIYRLDVFRMARAQPAPGNFRRRLLPVVDRRFLFVDPQNKQVLLREESQLRWRRMIANG